VPADLSTLKYRALLETSEAFIACRDYDTLLRTLWASLQPVMRFDYLLLVRYDQRKGTGWLEAIAGGDDLGLPLGADLPLEGTPTEILLASGEPLYVPDLRNETRFRPDVMERIARHGLLSGYWAPLSRGEKHLGSLGFSSRSLDAYTPEDRELMDHIARQVTIAVINALAFQEIRELRRKIEDEKVYLEEEIRAEYRFDEIVGSGPAIREVLQQIQTAAPTDSTVLIQGETGTGKELVARAIHQLSRRNHGTFIKLNCSAIPAALLESELLGHEKGAFTGALAARIGRFELAHRGTLFMDEIGELPLELQPKLLRVLQDGRFERLGGSRTIESDFRLVAATNQDLKAMVAEQRFRADLYYRINVFPITIPPLRERREDIPTLVRYFVQEFSTRMRKPIESIPVEAMTALVNYTWPGNIRELRNVLERSVIVTQGKRLRIPKDALDESAQTPDGSVVPMAEADRRHIVEALTASKWIVGGPKGAAAMLGLKRSTLQSKMEKLGIKVQRQIGAR
jgi:formate hydrogenlyase transcriptional activator